MPKVFICYRREDSLHQAGRIYDQLVLHFGKGDVFKDVDSRHVGRDYRKVLSEQVAQCEVLLVLIGDGWLNQDDVRELEDLNPIPDGVEDLVLGQREWLLAPHVTAGGEGLDGE